jgi:hypothetical protein
MGWRKLSGGLGSDGGDLNRHGGVVLGGHRGFDCVLGGGVEESMSLKLMEEIYLGVVIGGLIGGIVAMGVMYYYLRK